MKRFFTLFAALIATYALLAGNTITYTASSKLEGVYTAAFNVSITSHTFSAGVGTISFSGDVTSIGEYAFSYCYPLTSITIPNSVTEIGKYAFCHCEALTSITIPDSVMSIEMFAFAGCSALTSINLPPSLIVIEDCVFQQCTSLTSITIPNSVTDILSSAFFKCGFTSITIPSSVSNIDNSAFKYCTELTSIVIEPGNAIYDSRDSCNAIIETESNTIITGCQNTVIPNSITNIGDWAFVDCRLTSITIPSSVTNIGFAAFFGCTALASITSESITPPTCDRSCFYDVDHTIPLYVPAQSISAYQTAELWCDFTNIQPIQSLPMNTEVINKYDSTNKIFRNGQILIQRDSKTYNAQGIRVE